MVHNGTRPAKHIHKVPLYHDHFGSTSLDAIPDFNLDVGLTMPDQSKDNAAFECVGYTMADILTDLFKMPFSPDFCYAAARYISGDGAEGNKGTSFHGGMDALVGMGGLPASLAGITSQTQGEAYVSDWSNWDDAQKKASHSYQQNSAYNALGLGDAFDSILSTLYTNQMSVSMGSPWYREFEMNIQPDGSVQAPLNPQDLTGLGWHNYAAKGKKTINGVPYIQIKSWQGTRVGGDGWLYFPREAVNAAMSVEGSGALTINKNGNRWAYLVGVIVRRFPQSLSLAPQLLYA